MIDYYRYCASNSIFYRRPDPTDSDALPFNAEHPAGWDTSADSDWVYCIPDSYAMPVQGWKIHISATPANSAEILEIVMRYLVEQRVAFKYLPSVGAVFESNAKFYDRINSGKFITIYPPTERIGECLARTLGSALGAYKGPQILSDLRLYDSVVHTRYGAFVKIERNAYGGPVGYGLLGVNGELIADERGVFSELPESPVTTPEYYKHAFDHFKNADLTVPFHATEAIAFPNGGGVYRANLPNGGRQVIVKEGRRYAGLDALHEDAFTRVRREYEVLGAVKADGVPQAIDYIEVGDNAYLVESMAKGESFADWVGARHPAINGDIGDSRAVSDYIENVEKIFEHLIDAVGAVWASGHAHNDLQPSNIIVGADLSVCIIDFEAATTLDGTSGDLLVLGTPGFYDPSMGPGSSQDAFSLHRLGFYAIAPAVNVLDLSASAYLRTLDMAAHTFGSSAERFLDHVSLAVKKEIQKSTRSVSDSAISPWAKLEACPPWIGGQFESNNDYVFPDRGIHESTTRQIVEGTLNKLVDSTFDYFNADGISGFPGDIERYSGDGDLNLRTGDWGVLAAVGAVRPAPEEISQQIITRTRQHVWHSSGYLNGLVGVIDAVDKLGFTDVGTELASSAPVQERGLHDALNQDITFASGAAGRLFGLDRIIRRGSLEISRSWGSRIESDQSMLREALSSLSVQDSLPEELTKDGRSFVEGVSGVVYALCSLKTLEPYSNVQVFQDLCRGILEKELRRFSRFGNDPALYLDDEKRYLPYLGRGSLGVMLACLMYRNRFGDDVFDDRIKNMSQVLRARFTVVGGLFYGRAGLLWSSAYVPDDILGDMDREAMIRRHAMSLRAHLVEHDGHESLTGEYNLRSSLDVMTGSAGAVIALASSLNRIDGAQVAPDQWLPTSVLGEVNNHSNEGKQPCLQYKVSRI